MPPRVMTRSAGRPAFASRGGGTGGRVGREGRRVEIKALERKIAKKGKFSTDISRGLADDVAGEFFHGIAQKIAQKKVWNQVKIYDGLPNVSSSLNAITDHIIPMSKKKNARSVIAKLVFTASTYFIWQERNNRLFKSQEVSLSRLLTAFISFCPSKIITVQVQEDVEMMAFTHSLEVT
ncbi:hypothetical protein Tco_0199055 [Tanacetum coccineum]